MKKWILFLSVLFLISHYQTVAQTIILISKDKSENIKKWLLQSDSSVVTKEFYFLSPDSQQYYLAKSNGIVIGGGEDINPGLYKQEELISDCGKIDNYRDSIEYILIKHALKNKKPILGICRGQQILNVATGGSLIVDIPKTGKTTMQHSQPGIDSVHWVLFDKKSWLQNTTHLDSIMVNSSHHQAVDKISPLFKVTARGNDGIIEAIEWKDNNHPFAAAIQWHPERLYNQASRNMSLSFVKKVKAH
ncbi:MAG: gamma-glutamyl-gamma-aminobutyrate hydrolase family protein [Bacteroidota bacterium]